MSFLLQWVFFPILIMMAWEVFLREPVLAYSRKVRYRFLRRFGKEPPIGQIYAKLEDLCGVDSSTAQIKKVEGATGLSLDSCIEILHSHLYKGWRSHEIEYLPLAEPRPLNSDLADLIVRYPADPPNNGKYRLVNYFPDTSEHPRLRIQLAPTDYFSTFPIQQRLFEDVLVAEDGSACSPFAKYGKGLLEFGEHPLPNIVCVHAIVVMPNNKLLLTQRLRSADRIDWHAGKWSCSFEEQMTVKIGKPRNDKSFLDTAYAGCAEEFGLTRNDIADVRILSLVLETTWNVVVPIALIRVHTPFEDIRARWKSSAPDGISRELWNLAELNWSPEAIGPILRRETIEVGEYKIEPKDWHGTARMRLLQSLFHRDGINKTIMALTYPSRRT